jgi:hypothetical protein
MADDQPTNQQQEQRWIVLPENAQYEIRNVGGIDKIVQFKCPDITVGGCQPSMVICKGIS